MIILTEQRKPQKMRIKPDKIKSRDISAVTEHISKLTKNVVNFCEKKKQ